jgi:cytoskeletal protein RodZ
VKYLIYQHLPQLLQQTRCRQQHQKKQRTSGPLGALGFTSTNVSGPGAGSPGARVTRSTVNNNTTTNNQDVNELMEVVAEETSEDDSSEADVEEQEEGKVEEAESEVEGGVDGDEPYITVERTTDHGKVLKNKPENDCI